MKNRLYFVLIFVFLSTIATQAQDTIRRVSRKYYVNHPHWSDDTLELDTCITTWYHYFSGNARGETAKRCYTKDSLKVYGVAAAINVAGMTFPRGDTGIPHVIDTTYDSVCEYFRLYKYNSTGGLDVIAQTRVCALDSIVGYLMFKPQENLMGIYESYFEDGPITVIDTFFVGFTQYLDTQIVVDGRNMWLHWRMCLGCASFSLDLRYYMNLPDEELDEGFHHDKYCGWERFYRDSYYIFPIYNPDEYHPTPDPEPEGIDEGSGLARYVTVSPNPAQTEVKVVSSFPLKTIEAIDATGKKVYSQATSGPQATLDVREWPSGIYVLNVSTSVGVFTKKIVVK